MPLRLSVSHSRKTSENFCSTQHGLVVEAEVAEGTSAKDLRAKVEELFAFAKQAVNEQVEAAGGAEDNGGERKGNPAPRARIPTNGGTNRKSNGNGRTGRSRMPMVTEAQKKAIFAICKDQGLKVEEVLADWNGSADRLTIKEASEVIDSLKANR